MNIPIIYTTNVPTPASGYIYPFVDKEDMTLKAKKSDGSIIVFGGRSLDGNIQQVTYTTLSENEILRLNRVQSSLSSIQSSYNSMQSSLSSLESAFNSINSREQKMLERIEVLQQRLGSSNSNTSSTLEQRLLSLEQVANILQQI